MAELNRSNDHNTEGDKMLAKAVRRPGSNVVAVGKRTQEGNTIVYQYTSPAHLSAIAEELGPVDGQYVRIVCRADGSPAELMTDSRGRYMKNPHFGFEAGEAFCVVELQHGRVSIASIMLERSGNDYRLVCSPKAEGIPTSAVEGGTIPQELGCFIPAIEAGIKRMGCSDCGHVHYSLKHRTVATTRDRNTAAGIAAVDPRGKVVSLGANSRERAGFETSYLFSTKKVRGFAYAEERAGNGHVTVVCGDDGSMIRVWNKTQAERVTRFKFRLGDAFVIVRVEFDTIVVCRCTASELLGGYKLVIEELDDPLPLGHLRDGMLPEKLHRYTDAILAAVAKYGCRDCNHTHYGIEPL